jgi:hypothetical protein
LSPEEIENLKNSGILALLGSKTSLAVLGVTSALIGIGFILKKYFKSKK